MPDKNTAGSNGTKLVSRLGFIAVAAGAAVALLFVLVVIALFVFIR